MKKITEFDLHILVGLPGSGKTYFAKSMLSQNTKYNRDVTVLDFDEYFKTCGYNFDNIFKKFPRNFTKTIVADGLFLTQSEVETIIDRIGEYVETYLTNKMKMSSITIHQWKVDTDSCLWNDKGRRSEDSLISILNRKVEKINTNALKEKYNCTAHKILHDVVRKPKYIAMCEKYNIKPEYSYYDKDRKNPYFTSNNSWVLGGTSYGWDGSEHPLSASEPENFDEFDNLMEKICPNMTFLQYKKIYRKCVEQDERSISDYYTSGSEGYWTCNIAKLYDTLIEMGLLKEEEF